MEHHIYPDETNTVNLFESIVTSLNGYGLIATDVYNKVILWSKGAELIYGYKSSEMLNKHIPANLNEEMGDQTEYVFILEDSKNAPPLHDYKMNAKTKYGDTKPVLLSIAPRFFEGSACGLLLVVKDITKTTYEEKFKNLLLEVTQIVNSPKSIDDMCQYICEIVSSILESPIAFVCLFDYIGKCFNINSYVGLCSKCCKHECMQYSDKQTIPANMKGCYETYSHLTINYEKMKTHGIYKYIDKERLVSGDDYLLHIPLTVDDTLTGILHVITSEAKKDFLLKETQILSLVANEITSGIQRKRLIEKTREYADNLEKMVRVRTNQLREKDALLVQSGKLATLGEMATGIAHEINQPLGGISLMTQGLMLAQSRNKLTDEMLTEKLHFIINQVERINKIISHLRTFARQSDDIKREVNIKQPLLDVFKLIGEQLAKRDITVEFKIEENLPLILADHNKLEQLFLNIIGNARDAIEELETFADKADDAAKYEWIKTLDKRIIITMHSTEKSVIIEICDNGIGISAEVIQKIFNPFFTTKEVGKGTGLGLSITYGIVKEFGGTIEVESMVLHGSKFTIKFPVYIKTD